MLIYGSVYERGFEVDDSEDRYMIIPDIVRTETTPVLTAFNQAYTADRVGFLKIELTIGASNDGYTVGYYLTRNSVTEGKDIVKGHTEQVFIVPVDVGDVIMLSTVGILVASSIVAHFVPIKKVEVIPPRAVSSNALPRSGKLGRGSTGVFCIRSPRQTPRSCLCQLIPGPTLLGPSSMFRLPT